MEYATAEIFSMDTNYGAARSEQELYELLARAHADSGTWAIAVAAGNADQPMKVVAMIDAGGNLYKGDHPVNCFCDGLAEYCSKCLTQ